MNTWKSQGLCTGLTWLFYPTKGELDTARHAKEVCQQCPVIDPCLDYAVVNYEKFGIWGGTSEKERRIIRKSRGLPADLPVEETA